MPDYELKSSPKRTNYGLDSTVPGYVQGIWTPYVENGNIVAPTYLFQYGAYTRIGNLCFVSCYLQINQINDGIQDTIRGLPFLARTPNVEYTRDLFTCWWNGTTTTDGTTPRSIVYMVGETIEGTDNVTLYSATAADDNLTSFDVLGNGTVVVFSGFYKVDVV